MVLKKGGDVSAFEKELERVVWDKADVRSLVSKRSFGVRHLDETVTREEVVAAVCITLSGRKYACWRCPGATHVANECKAPPWCRTCADRGGKDFAHAPGSGSCPIFRAELRRFRGGK